MKTIILFFTLLFSLTAFSGTTPTSVVIWGNVPPSAAKPGDAIHFIAVAQGGSDLEYRFLSKADGDPLALVKDWGTENFANVNLPTNFGSVTYYAQARGAGLTERVTGSQIFGYLKDITLSTSQAQTLDTIKVFHPSFQVG